MHLGVYNESMPKHNAFTDRDQPPIPGSARSRLVEAARIAFEQDGYAGAQVTRIAGAAGVTTGSLYHHFGDKLDLYTGIRTEWARRVGDRMAGALAARPGSVRTMLAAALEAAIEWNVVRLLGEPMPGDGPDPLEAILAATLPQAWRESAPVLSALLRGALCMATTDRPKARRALDHVVRTLP